ALTAAREAARAGERGRGFAVVADEVRALAKRTADSTDQIHRLIDDLQQATGRTLDTMRTGKDQADRGVAHVIAADEALDRIREAISRVSAIGAEHAGAAEEQRAGAEALNGGRSNIGR